MKKAGIFLILLAFLCVGQGFGPKIVKGPTPSSPIAVGGPLPLGINYRWVDADIPNGSAASWTDRIHTHVFYQNTVDNQPTKGGSGLSFDGGDTTHGDYFITDSNVVTVASNTTYCIMFNASSSAPVPPWGTFIGDGNLGGNGVMLKDNQTTWYMDGPSAITQLSSAITRDTMQDIIATGAGQFYTNGVLSVSLLFSSGHNTIFQKIGAEQSTAGDAFKGLIREIIIWTGTNLTAANVSNIHYYRTNTYGGSP